MLSSNHSKNNRIFFFIACLFIFILYSCQHNPQRIYRTYAGINPTTGSSDTVTVYYRNDSTIDLDIPHFKFKGAGTDIFSDDDTGKYGQTFDSLHLYRPAALGIKDLEDTGYMFFKFIYHTNSFKSGTEKDQIMADPNLVSLINEECNFIGRLNSSDLTFVNYDTSDINPSSLRKIKPAKLLQTDEAAFQSWKDSAYNKFLDLYKTMMYADVYSLRRNSFVGKRIDRVNP